ncbi:MAG: dimethyl sulfoxide reductase anchor subunit [Hyphomicrobiales bacterium]|nr:dimethyl sulfoxide reductase anchor subunit [Hyphomicrobiales bacterium]
MNPAYSVILFTTASGAGYGLLALLGLVGFNHGPASSLIFGLTAIVFALGLITIGLLSSTFHLGHPERAWRAFSQWRTSWLSREGVAAVLTYLPAVLFAATWLDIIHAPALIGPLGLITAAMCAVTVFCTAKIYSSLKTIRAWNHPLTVPVYLAFALASGGALLTAIATIFDRFQIFQVILTGAALLVLIALKFFYWRGIDSAERTHTMAAATGLGAGVRQWEVPHTSKNYIMKEMGFAVARKHAVKLRGAVFLILFITLLALAVCLISPWLSLLAAPAILIAAVLERWLFFAEAQHVVSLYYGTEKA